MGGRVHARNQASFPNAGAAEIPGSSGPAAYSGKVADGATEARKRGDLAELLRLLADTDRVTRLGAAQELGKLGDPAALATLIRTLQANDDLLRMSAVKALARLGLPEAIPALHETAVSDRRGACASTPLRRWRCWETPRASRCSNSLQATRSRLWRPPAVTSPRHRSQLVAPRSRARSVGPRNDVANSKTHPIRLRPEGSNDPQASLPNTRAPECGCARRSSCCRG
jgi:hypothetical protein